MIRKAISLLLIALVFEFSYSLEFIFRDDPFYEEIEFLSLSSAIEMNLSDLPIRSDDLINAIENAWIDRMGKGKDFTQQELSAINNILTRFSEKNDFIIKDNAEISIFYEDSASVNFKNMLYLKKNIPYGIISADFRTTAPFENTDSTIFRMDEWKGTGSDCHNTYISFFGEDWHVLAGRIHPAWGQGIKDDIFISRKILPMDGILANVDWGRMSFSFFAVNKSEYHLSNKATSNNAYLSAHKLSFSLPFRSKFSFKEIVLYKSNLPQLYYLNPAMFYYIIQYNSHSDDNIFWSMEFANEFIRGLLVSGELFIDDFQYEIKDFYVPNKIGILLNAQYSPGFLENSSFYAEYCRLNTYTNTHEFTSLSYSYYKVPMSYLFGTDMDNISLGLRLRPVKNMKTSFDLSYLRKGDGELENSWESERPDSAPSFPSGTVDKIFSVGIKAEYFILKYFSLSVDAQELFFSGYDPEGETAESRHFNLTGKIKVIL